MSDPKSAIDDVIAGRSKHAVICGDVMDVLPLVPDASIHVSYNDPPYGLSEQNIDNIVECLRAWLDGKVYTHNRQGFMGKEWDAYVPGPEAWREVHRVLKPGAYNVSFSSTRTVDLLGIAVRLAGFDVRPGWSWLQGCLSDDTELLTDKGWVQYQQITTTHAAMCYDTSNGNYQWQTVEEVFVYPYSDTAYRVHSDRTDQIVTRNHRCLVERGGELVFQVAEEASLEREVRVPVLEDVQSLLSAIPVQIKERAAAKADVQPRVCDRCDSRCEHGPNEASRGTARDRAPVCCMRRSGDTTDVSRYARRTTFLFKEMLRDVEIERSGHARPTQIHREERQAWVDRCVVSFVQVEDVRRQKPSVEGRSDSPQDSRELRGSEVREVPRRVRADGAEGWVRDGAPPYRRGDHGKVLVSDRNSASRQPRPDGQQAGEPQSVRIEQGSQDVRASRFTVTDLVRIDAVDYTGIVWCVRVPTGAFVARRNGKVFVTGNSGFPKSLDVSKAIDDAAGEKRIVVGDRLRPDGTTRDRSNGGVVGSSLHGSSDGTLNTNGAMSPVTAPATEAAKQWDGYGTDVKPAYEPLVVARKGMDGTVAANVLAHGCGVLNIDAARIGDGNLALNPHLRETINGGNGGNIFPREDERRVVKPNASGRFPAALALVHDEDCELVGAAKIRGDARQGGGAREGGFVDTGAPCGDGVPNSAGKANADGTETVDEWRCTETCAVAELARQSGDRSSPWVGNTRGNSVGKKGGVMFGGSPQSIDSKTEYLDIGSAARFFYQAKASASDRLAYVTCSDGCAHHDSVAGVRDARATASEPTKEHPHGLCLACNAPRAHYQHPTVKPQSLANWHAKLLSLPEHVSPIAIVPYCGTGIEAKALLDAGFRVIAIDIDPRHCVMTEFRLTNGAQVEARATSGASPVQPKRVAAQKKPADVTAQLDLFGALK